MTDPEKNSATRQIECPTCRQPFLPHQTNAMPFCSSRCRQIDFGRWFDEKYSVPWSGRDDEALLEDGD